MDYAQISTLAKKLNENISRVIVGKEKLCGGSVDSYNDHRIAMSAAIASLICENAVQISHFEAINKSYPSFAENFIE